MKYKEKYANTTLVSVDVTRVERNMLRLLKHMTGKSYSKILSEAIQDAYKKRLSESEGRGDGE